MNDVSLIGRFTADPELRKTPEGISVTTFTLAVDRSYVKAGEERQADFIDLVVWRGQAEFICKHFGKGDAVGISGSIQTRHFEDKEGRKRKAVEVLVNNVSFAGRTKKDAETKAKE